MINTVKFVCIILKTTKRVIVVKYLQNNNIYRVYHFVILLSIFYSQFGMIISVVLLHQPLLNPHVLINIDPVKIFPGKIMPMCLCKGHVSDSAIIT